MDTRVYKDRDGWNANTTIDFDAGRQLVIRTYKRPNSLLTTASVFTVLPDGGTRHLLGFGSGLGDFYGQLIVSKPARTTAKVVALQHGDALAQIDKIKATAFAHYAAQPAANLTAHPANPLPWLLVENPGMDDEDIVDDFPTHADAVRAQQEHGQGDIMKRLSDGTLTTEF